MKSVDISDKEVNKGIIRTSRHKPMFDTASINRAVKRAIKDAKFLNNALESIKLMKFPAYKNDILRHLKNMTNDEDTISLFQSLDGYIQYNDLHHIRKSIEHNIPEKKLENQISNQKRQEPNVRMRETTSNKSIKEREAVNPDEERKDYPEVTPTAMSVFTCSMCGKHFQNQDDLVHHRRFEGGVKEDKQKGRNK